jgi:hypothetical protein
MESREEVLGIGLAQSLIFKKAYGVYGERILAISELYTRARKRSVARVLFALKYFFFSFQSRYPLQNSSRNIRSP